MPYVKNVKYQWEGHVTRMRDGRWMLGGMETQRNEVTTRKTNHLVSRRQQEARGIIATADSQICTEMEKAYVLVWSEWGVCDREVVNLLTLRMLFSINIQNVLHRDENQGIQNVYKQKTLLNYLLPYPLLVKVMRTPY